MGDVHVLTAPGDTASWVFHVDPGFYAVGVSWDPTAAFGTPGTARYTITSGANTAGPFDLSQAMPVGALGSTAIMDGTHFLLLSEGFEVPALVTNVDNLEDRAGDVHEWLAYTLIALVTLHAGAAVKHHFIDRDDTLKRMLGRSSS